MSNGINEKIDETDCDNECVLVCECGQEFKEEIKLCDHKKYCNAYKLYLKHNHPDLTLLEYCDDVYFLHKKNNKVIDMYTGEYLGKWNSKTASIFCN
jgi:hypothetical protein